MLRPSALSRRGRSRALLLLVWTLPVGLGACTVVDDRDGDGYGLSEGDCDDLNAAAAPELAEVCDGADNNCDGQTDEGFDEDGDDWIACSIAPDGVLSLADCDDTNPDIYPGAEEVWGDGIDGDCDGLADADVYVAAEGASPEVDKPRYDDIQAAVDASTDGDVIGVAAGVWAPFDFGGKSVKVVSLDGADATSIVGEDGRSVVRIAAGEGVGTWLKGFTLLGGEGDALGVCGHQEGASHGGALCIQGSSPRILDNVIHSSRATWGAGIYVYDASPWIEGNELRSNRATRGGGIAVVAASPVLTRNEIHDNFASAEGGGIHLQEATPRIRYEWVYGNSALNGGGISAWRGAPELLNSRVVGNRASAGGGGLYLFESAASMEYLSVSANGASEGGGFYLYRAAPTASQLIVAANAATGEGGGLYMSLSSAPVLRFFTVVGNQAAAGGGLYSSGSSPETYAGIFAWNEADEANNAWLSGGIPDGEYTFYSAEGTFDGFSTSDITDASEDEAGLAGIAFEDGDLTGDPAFTNDPRDGSSADDDYRLLEDSRAVDVLPTFEGSPDPDGTEGDLGAFGGPDAAGWDLDGDGATWWWSPDVRLVTDRYDCDDLDPDVYPGRGC